MPRILVTGATGFIGSRLLLQLKSGHEIHALTRTGTLDRMDDVNWIQQDLTQPLNYARLPKEIDAVIHLAQSRKYRHFPQQAADIFGVNVFGTFQLLEYARLVGAKRFIFASSGGVYGYSYEKFVETDPVHPLNFYLSSKYSAELLVGNYGRYFSTIVLRFFFVYGPGQNHMLIPTLLQRIRDSEPLLLENPEMRINPIYVEDAMKVFEPALELEGTDVFNIAGDEAVSILRLSELCEEVLRIKSNVTDKKTTRQGDLVASNDRMKEILGVNPTTSLADGLLGAVANRINLA